MSHSATYTDTGRTTSFYQGMDAGERKERERVLSVVEYFIATACKCDSCNTAREIRDAIKDVLH